MATQLDAGPPSSARPTGTVAFLFTDIEGSTQRWESHRDAMDDAVKRHDTLLREAVERHNGYVFKAIGDAFCVAFARVSDVVATACDAQRTLSAEDFSAVGGLPVRMGLHAGEASERNGDYFGPAVNRVARLMSIGHGGQILISGVTRDLAYRDLPAGASLLDLGSHRLKDLTEAEQVWQLSIAGLPAEFAELKSLDTLPNNLPIQRTSFRGRERDLEEVKTLLSQHKLLTLFGSGGVGKTRLALQVGAEVLDYNPDGVWLIDFAPITDPELVASVIAQAIGMAQVEGRRVDESIPQWLRRKQLLLIFDNCEHILETVAAIADAIAGSCPDVRMLATSRQALGVSGEQVVQLPSLDVPHKIADLTPAAIMEFGAVALFVDRARSIDRSFKLTDDTAPIVADICRRLDGIPLAIELAAARVKVLSIPNLAQRLNERFKILTGGSRSALPRQKTLSALIDWSYDLLAPQEQLLFNRVGIFAGGFSLDAATAVCSDCHPERSERSESSRRIDEIDILDLLSSLTDKSLVVADTSGEHERYRLLESTAAYALEKLSAAGEHERMARRHAEYFLDQARAADERLGMGSMIAWVAESELELDNDRSALEWALTRGNDAVLGGAIAGALGSLWRNAGLTVEGRYWIGLALERVSEAEHSEIAARLWLALSGLSSGQRMHDTAQRAMRRYATVGDARWTGRAQRIQAFALAQMGRLDEAKTAIEEALVTARACGDAFNLANCLDTQAAIAVSDGDVRAARELFTQALAAYKALGNESGTAVVLGNTAELEFAEKHPELALQAASEALEILVRGKNAAHIAYAHTNCTAYRIAIGDLSAARDSAREALRVARQVQSDVIIAGAMLHLALLAVLGGDAQRCGRLLGYAEAQFTALGVQRGGPEQWGYDKLMAPLRETLSADEIARLAAEGAAWSEDQAVAEALAV
ncbi:MAG TPA: adenylate/guanylate cyclase domain-containing protein [Candidatus Babeliales bacterium]|nr:adenylate/guanylate cyclase domain-containing protein [Candidatus Babeliales bacterium]